MKNKLTFRPATKDDYIFIAKGFHMAMLMEDTDEAQIRLFAENVCNRNDVLYCAKNTIIAEWDGVRAGMITSYDGRYYAEMRKKTFAIVKEKMGIEFPNMEDEAKYGEYYLDSLAVWKEFRGKGIGRQLLQYAISEGQKLDLTVTLAVDPVNTSAQKLYESLGFKRAGDLFIFGHTYWKMEIKSEKVATHNLSSNASNDLSSNTNNDSFTPSLFHSFSLNNVSIGYDKYVVASDINASLNEGELTCLIGRNGAGKSTLLRTLSAFQPALTGSIEYKGENIAEMTPKDRSKLIGVVLTERTDIQNMTVRELVGMGRAPYTGFFGNLSKEDDAIVDEAIEQVGITELAKRMIQTLSDGERQKVMIAKALAQQTPVIFLDEPTAFLDFPSKVETMQLLSHLAHDLGKIIFLSTHDVEIALQMADKLWFMEKGGGVNSSNSGTISIGTPRKLADDGSISRFIERKNVQFDRETLTIKIV